MQIDPDSRRRVFRRIALGGALLTLPMIGYGLGYMQGSSAPEPAPRAIVLDEAPAHDEAPAVELAEAGAAKQEPATPEPAVLPEEPLAAESAPQPESLELAADLTAPAAEAEAVFANPADEVAPAEKLGKEEAALLQPAVTQKAADEAGDLDSAIMALTTEELPEDPLRTETLTVQSGDTLMGLLTEAGIARGEAYEAITALEEVFSPRRLRAGQEITVALSNEAEAASLMSLVLQPDAETDVSVDRGDSGSFVALAKPRELTRGAEYGRGTIESSLYEASLSAGMPHGTLMELIRVFSFDVDFQRDIHKGDGFEVIYDLLYDKDGEIAKTGEVRFASLILGGKERRYYRYTTEEGETDYFDPEGKSVRRTLMRTPIDGARLSSQFGMRKHPILGYSRMHKGTDFAAPSGTPIYAAGNGKVVVAGRNGGYGNYIRIRHNSRYQTAYAHLKGFARGVSAGARVEQGQIIGYVGTTGRSTGPHLHYEVLVDGTQVNPRNIKLPTGTVLAGADLEKFQIERAKIEQELAELSLGATQVAEGEQDCRGNDGSPIEQGSRDC